MTAINYICPHCLHKFAINKSAIKSKGKITCPICKQGELTAYTPDSASEKIEEKD
jgi:DNA-directed RNA polymerase subunit RPC12/RpoP